MRSPEISPVFEALHAGLDAALALDAGAMSDRELEASLAELHSARAQLDATEARTISEWDARRLWVGRGAQTADAALGFRRRLPSHETRRPVRRARFLRTVPDIAAALAAGEIDAAHVQRIAGCDNPRTHDALVADQRQLADWARTLHWSAFVRALQDWLEAHDQDGPEPPDLQHRKVKLSRTIDDRWYLTGVLTTLGGTTVFRELDRLEHQLFDADWAEAKNRLGREPLVHELSRTHEQRRHDALVLMAERSATLPEDGRRGQPLFLVLTGHDAFAKICELSNGIQTRPSQLVPHLGEAIFETIVFDGPFHAVKVSQQRTYRDALRRVAQAIYRGCVDPECDATIDDCQIDHHDPAVRGGPTSQDNARLRCAPSNRRKGGRPHPRDDQVG